MRTVGAVTTSRADYSSLLPVLRAIDADSELQLQLFVGGMHLAPEFGLTVNEIEANGFNITDRIGLPVASDTPQDIATSMGHGLIAVAQALEKFRPEIVLIVGDRYELLSVVCAALPLRIPVAHISGGDVTEGAIDNQVRNAISKLSHIHFPDMKAHGDRLIQMGEEPSRVIVAGDPALDLMHQIEYMSRTELSESLSLELESPIIMVSYHPTTLGADSVAKEVDALLSALAEVGGTQVFTYPNADADNQTISDRIRKFVDSRPNSRLFFSLGQARYYSMLAIADLMVGNSSSGIFEAPSFLLPVVNVGDRQHGRIRERNVIDVKAELDEIRAGIQYGLDPSFRDSLVDLKNPYGDGEATPRILNMLKEVKLGPELLQKSFVDLKLPESGPVISG